MKLDVIVNGPGSGETIILRWQENGSNVGALVDCFAPGGGRDMIEWLDDLGIDRLRLFAVTHPHLDHFLGAPRILQAWEGRVDCLAWWGYASPGQYIRYFERLAELHASQDEDLRLSARTLKELLLTQEDQLLNHAKPFLVAPLMGDRVPVGANPKACPVKIKAIGPSRALQARFEKPMLESALPAALEAPVHRRANDASLGFLMEFAGHQLVLGGDIEAEGWRHLVSEHPDWIFKPSLVKVSHHGSRTGRIDGMWQEGGILCRNRAPPKGEKLAVVTPWRGTLPENEVLDEIARAGWRVLVTGQSPSADPSLGKSSGFRSYVHLTIDAEEGVSLVERSPTVREHLP